MINYTYDCITASGVNTDWNVQECTMILYTDPKTETQKQAVQSYNLSMVAGQINLVMMASQSIFQLQKCSKKLFTVKTGLQVASLR